VPPTWRDFMAEWVGDPERDAELLRERSPITYVDQIRAPLLVIQGAKDPRVQRLYQAGQQPESLPGRGRVLRAEAPGARGGPRLRLPGRDEEAPGPWVPGASPRLVRFVAAEAVHVPDGVEHAFGAVAAHALGDAGRCRVGGHE